MDKLVFASSKIVSRKQRKLGGDLAVVELFLSAYHELTKACPEGEDLLVDLRFEVDSEEDKKFDTEYFHALVHGRDQVVAVKDLDGYVTTLIYLILNASERGYSLRSLLTCALEDWKTQQKRREAQS